MMMGILVEFLLIVLSNGNERAELKSLRCSMCYADGPWVISSYTGLTVTSSMSDSIVV